MKKNAVIISAVMLALMTAGVAYAHWTKIITIEGTVDTGSLDVQWFEVGSNDCGEQKDPGLWYQWPDDLGWYHSDTWDDSWAAVGDYARYDKHVASTCVEIDPDDEDNVKVTIDQAYPSYAPMVDLWFIGVGSVPAHLEGFEMTYYGTDGTMYTGEMAGKMLDEEGGLELIGWWVTETFLENGDPVATEVLYGVTKGSYTGMPYPVDEVDAGIWCMPLLKSYLMGSDDYPVPGYGPFPGLQVHEGEVYDVHLLFHFQEHTPQDVPEDPCHEYSFEIELTWINYNEDAMNPSLEP